MPSPHDALVRNGCVEPGAPFLNPIRRDVVIHNSVSEPCARPAYGGRLKASDGRIYQPTTIRMAMHHPFQRGWRVRRWTRMPVEGWRSGHSRDVLCGPAANPDADITHGLRRSSHAQISNQPKGCHSARSAPYGTSRSRCATGSEEKRNGFASV